jgi:SAM-dependent methyltransferase
MKSLLHVGCGPVRIGSLPYFRDGGWDEIRYDIDPSVDPDIVGTSLDMSIIEDGAVDAIWSSHNIEHVWSYEVPVVLREFRRVLRPDGFLVVLCPDVLQLAEAVVQGQLEETLYHSPAGPITTIDVLYGHQASLRAGNTYMAHKMAFTSDTLAGHLLRAGFACAVVLRDRAYGLHAVASAEPAAQVWAERMAEQCCTAPQLVFEGKCYGRFAAGAPSS